MVRRERDYEKDVKEEEYEDDDNDVDTVPEEDEEEDDDDFDNREDATMKKFVDDEKFIVPKTQRRRIASNPPPLLDLPRQKEFSTPREEIKREHIPRKRTVRDRTAPETNVSQWSHPMMGPHDPQPEIYQHFPKRFNPRCVSLLEFSPHFPWQVCVAVTRGEIVFEDFDLRLIRIPYGPEERKPIVHTDAFVDNGESIAFHSLRKAHSLDNDYIVCSTENTLNHDNYSLRMYKFDQAKKEPRFREVRKIETGIDRKEHTTESQHAIKFVESMDSGGFLCASEGRITMLDKNLRLDMIADFEPGIHEIVGVHAVDFHGGRENKIVVLFSDQKHVFFHVYDKRKMIHAFKNDILNMDHLREDKRVIFTEPHFQGTFITSVYIPSTHKVIILTRDKADRYMALHVYDIKSCLEKGQFIPVSHKKISYSSRCCLMRYMHVPSEAKHLLVVVNDGEVAFFDDHVNPYIIKNST